MNNDTYLTRQDKIKNAFREAFITHAVPDSLKKEARKWNFIKQEVSKIMEKKLIGRVSPIINSKGSTNKPTYLQRHISPFVGCYPKWVETDKDKLKYLNIQLDNDTLKMGTYLELVSVLKKIRKKDIRPQTDAESIDFGWCV